MSIGRVCQREVDVASSDEPVLHAAERMHQRSVGTLVVVDHERRPQGIVTDRDLVIKVLAPGKDAARTTVGQIMTQHPDTIHEEAPIEAAFESMRRHGARRLPVIDRKGVLVGLVSVDDLLALIIEELSQVGGLLARQTPQAAAN